MDELDLTCEVCETILLTVTIPTATEIHADELSVSGLFCAPCYQEHLAELAAEADDDPPDEYDNEEE